MLRDPIIITGIIVFGGGSVVWAAFNLRALIRERLDYLILCGWGAFSAYVAYVAMKAKGLI